MTIDIEQWLAGVRSWAATRPDIVGVALVGSHATGGAREDSDVDVVVVFESMRAALADLGWLRTFGTFAEIEEEDYGLVQSRRVRYDGGPEVEWGITDRRWVAIAPVDEPTADVVRAGLRIVHDPTGVVAALAQKVAEIDPPP